MIVVSDRFFDSRDTLNAMELDSTKTAFQQAMRKHYFALNMLILLDGKATDAHEKMDFSGLRAKPERIKKCLYSRPSSQLKGLLRSGTVISLGRCSSMCTKQL